MDREITRFRRAPKDATEINSKNLKRLIWRRPRTWKLLAGNPMTPVIGAPIDAQSVGVGVLTLPNTLSSATLT